MHTLLPNIARVMDSALANICEYMADEFEIDATVKQLVSGEITALTLREMTSIIGIGGAVDLFMAFSFEQSLIQALYDKMTEGMEISEEEAAEMKNATAAEIINIIAGHCTTDLQDMDSEIISITPPTVLNLVKTVPKMERAIFHLRTITTASGDLDIYLIGPRELFSDHLDYVK